ncbi:hypothetical protein BH24ACT14_BH24ACT14_04570 [soil metagenome]
MRQSSRVLPLRYLRTAPTHRRLRRASRLLLFAGLIAALLAPQGVAGASASTASATTARQPSSVRSTGTYRNPLDLRTRAGEVVETCADPAVIRGQERGDKRWYLYCTTDPLSGDDRNAEGEYNFRLIPTFTSRDLVHWTYRGDVFEERPEWMGDGGPWAPEPFYANGQYYMYYTAPNVPSGGSAIGVATSPTPLGPWTDKGGPVVEPHAPPGGEGLRWVFDPEVINANGKRYIYYGSYFGGLSVRELSPDGLSSNPATQTEVAIGNRYEGTQIIKRRGWYYLLASATNCCAGPLTGYSVFAGRSRSPLGPFTDRDGDSLLAGRVGGTPVISMNGNRWVGTGHHDVINDFDGQQWMIYHAVDQNDPYLTEPGGINQRPALLDPLDWINGWPTVRARRWASDRRISAPAAQPGQTTAYRPRPVGNDRNGPRIKRPTDTFNRRRVEPGWEWVRRPDPDTYGTSRGNFVFQTQAADLFVDSNTASVLVRPAPRGDFMMTTKVNIDVPPEGCCYNFVQAGLVAYGDDDNFLKLTNTSIFETRQTEWAKERSPVPDGYPRYGNSVVGAPGRWTFLRIVKRDAGGQQHYTAYTRHPGARWVRGGTWVHDLGEDSRIGLVSMGGDGFTAKFAYVRVHRLRR